MPQQTFRQPSVSALDRTQNDPTASETTPKINFKWKRDGKLSKDLVCNLSGKSTNPDGSKRKNKEPDITIALFRHLKEITIYEPNLSRVEMEDPKGLEVVLLLSAVVIREVFFGQMKEVFNITETPRQNELVPRKSSAPSSARVLQDHVPHSRRPPQRGSQDHPQVSRSSGSRPPLQVQTSNPRPPPTDPRSQWEIDVETARLKKQVEHEERERKRAEHAEMKRVKKMIEAEEREARRRQAEVDAETERLKREYAAEQRRLEQRTSKPHTPPRHEIPQRHSVPLIQMPYPRPQRQHQQRTHSGRPYLQPPGMNGHASSSGFFNGPSTKPDDGRRLGGKRSFFGLRSHSDNSREILTKKQSSIF